MHQKITAMCTVYSFPLVHHFSPARGRNLWTFTSRMVWPLCWICTVQGSSNVQKCKHLARRGCVINCVATWKNIFVSQGIRALEKETCLLRSVPLWNVTMFTGPVAVVVFLDGQGFLPYFMETNTKKGILRNKKWRVQFKQWQIRTGKLILTIGNFGLCVFYVKLQ
jgi:hypothetical protein